MTTRSNSALFALVACTLIAFPLRAEPTPADVEAARTLYVQGLELRDRGELARSLDRFQAAQKLAPTPITSLELGRAHMLLGQLIDAREAFLVVSQLPHRPNESPKASAARTEASELAHALDERIPTVTLHLATRPAGDLSLKMDGEELPPQAIDTSRAVNPGAHQFVARVGALEAKADVSLAERERKTVTLSWVSSHPKEAEPPRRDRGWLYASLALTGVGAATGTVAGLFAIDAKNQLAPQCADTRCPPSAANDLSAGRTWATVSTIGFVAAGVGAVAAIVFLLSGSSSAPASSAQGAR